MSSTIMSSLGGYWRGRWEDARPQFQAFAAGARVSGRTILALLLRESRSRFGQRSAGYVWALMEPMLLLVILMLVFNALGRPPGAGESMVVFFLTAIIPVRLWRGSITRGGNAIRANRGLMRYPQVNAFEVVTARTMLESLTMCIVTLLFILIMFSFFGLPFTAWIDRPLPLLGAIGTALLLCYGSCFLSSQIGRIFDPWNEITGPLGRLILLTSGLWFTMGSLPPEFLAIVKYNPMVHVVEWTRTAVIRDFRSDLFNPYYPLILGTVFLAVGMFIDWLHRIGGYDLE